MRDTEAAGTVHGGLAGLAGLLGGVIIGLAYTGAASAQNSFGWPTCRARTTIELALEQPPRLAERGPAQRRQHRRQVPDRYAVQISGPLVPSVYSSGGLSPRVVPTTLTPGYRNVWTRDPGTGQDKAAPIYRRSDQRCWWRGCARAGSGKAVTGSWRCPGARHGSPGSASAPSADHAPPGLASLPGSQPHFPAVHPGLQQPRPLTAPVQPQGAPPRSIHALTVARDSRHKRPIVTGGGVKRQP